MTAIPDVSTAPKPPSTQKTSSTQKRWNITPPGSKMVKLQKDILEQTQKEAREATLAPLEAKKTTVTTAATHVSGLRHGFQALQAATAKLTNFATRPLYAVQNRAADGAVSISTTATATAATMGDIEVNVVAMARADRITSNTTNPANIFTSATTELNLSGDLVLNEGTPITLTTEDTLNSIAHKINTQSETRAWVTQLDDGKYVLTLSSSTLCTPINGSASEPGLWDALHLPPTTNVSDLQANLTVNGISNIMRNSNTVDVLEGGVQLVLNKPSTSTTMGTIVEDTTSFNNDLAGFVAAYNACQQAVSSERAADPSDPNKSAPTALLKDFDFFLQVEALLRVPFDLTNSNNLTFASFGYIMKNGQLEADTKFASTKLTMQDRKNFFAANATVSSSDFTQTMPNTFDKAVQNNLHILSGNPITVTIAHNVDDTYTATLSASGLADLILPYNPLTGNIRGTGVFNGLNISHNGDAIALGENTSTTITLNRGVANHFYRALDNANTTYDTAPSVFDMLAGEIKSKQDFLDKEIKDKTAYLDKKSEETLKGSAKVAALEAHLKSMGNLVKRAIGKRSRDD